MSELCAADDYFVHTGPEPLSDQDATAARSPDPRAFERHWNVWHDDVGDLLIATGGSWYPNLNRVEAYAIVNYRGDHRSVRAMRPAGTECSDLDVGPIKPTILEGLQRWRHQVAPGEWGFSFDLSWSDTHRPVYAAAWGPEVAEGARQVNAGFETFGQVTGWIQIGQKRIEWAPGDAHGTRDRHWGVGRGIGGPRLNGGTVHRPGWKGGIWIDLGDVGLWGKRLLYPHSDRRVGAGKVARIDRLLRFEKDTQLVTGGLITLELEDGSRRELRLERLGNQIAFMRCGFYGGTPRTNWYQGEYDGPELVEWDRFDVNTGAARKELRGLDEHHCRVVINNEAVTTGILQPVEPDVYQACVDGKPGWDFWT